MDTTNEPVAWMDKRTNKCVVFINTPPSDDWIPLYTHPVKELDEQFKKGFEAGKEEGWKAHKFHHPVKELTDEEIMEVAYSLKNSYEPYNINFARAILRKASEK
jgi:hypothetical protein